MLKTKNAFMIIAFLCLTFLFSGCSKPAVPTSISVDSSNAKYWYVSGTEIDPSGLVIHASMTDGTTKEIPVQNAPLRNRLLRLTVKKRSPFIMVIYLLFIQSIPARPQRKPILIQLIQFASTRMEAA